MPKPMNSKKPRVTPRVVVAPFYKALEKTIKSPRRLRKFLNHQDRNTLPSLLSNLNAYGQSPLTCAILSELIISAQVLLEYGADPNSGVTEKGYTPLMQAVEGNHTELLEKLLDARADLSAQTEEGVTATSLADDNHFEAQMILNGRLKAPPVNRFDEDDSDDDAEYHDGFHVYKKQRLSNQTNWE